MKKHLSVFPAISLLLIAMLFCSCDKIFDGIDRSRNPLQQGCEVAEYHLPLYDSYRTGFPLLFKKTYDPSGKILKEIDCSFNDDVYPPSAIQHNLIVQQKGLKLFLFDKNNPSDTMMTVSLNAQGRAESCTTKAALNDCYGNSSGDTEYFIYKNNRIFSIKTVWNPAPSFSLTQTDTVHYDSHGNLLSFGPNVYQYDYTRTAKQQFYIDDEMPASDGYYLLQYLGFFPEVTSPVNIRILLNDGVFTNRALVDHQFDAEGKLVGYDYDGPDAHITITWNCQNTPFQKGL